MKPAGRDRDKQIAELLGWRVDCIHGNDCPCWLCEECPCFCDANTEKPEWSTDRNDAWELWDLMKSKVTSVRLESNEGSYADYICSIRFYDDYRKKHLCVEYSGKDEADAISGAFVLWKEELI